MLSKSILIVKTIREKNLKIQMLAGNSLNSFFDASFKKTMTLGLLLFDNTSIMFFSTNSGYVAHTYLQWTTEPSQARLAR